VADCFPPEKVHAYVYIYTYIHIYRYTHVCIYRYMYIYGYMYICIFCERKTMQPPVEENAYVAHCFPPEKVHAYVYTFMHIYIYIGIGMYICICICIYVYIYIHSAKDTLWRYLLMKAYVAHCFPPETVHASFNMHICIYIYIYVCIYVYIYIGANSSRTPMWPTAFHQRRCT